MQLPVANFAPRRVTSILMSLPLAVTVGWGIWHILSVISAFINLHGNPLALTFFASFLLMWWVPISWMEKPFTATKEDQADLDNLVVTVHVPVYNEDEPTLRDALISLFDQTRLPNRIHVVNDGSENNDGTPMHYDATRQWFELRAAELGIETKWVRTINRGKRHAQMETLSTDDADVFITLDSDSTLDRSAIDEGLKPFANPKVMSVAGMVVVWNSRKNFLTRLTCMLYTPFTRGFRSAQSVLGRVMVNSGTLAFYRADVVREMAGSYENERFMGRPMQMNDDSMLTFYAMLKGRTVHQPTSVAFTIVPDRFKKYIKQQMRWMRGTFIRTWWWFKYLKVSDPAFWMAFFEMVQLILALIVIPALFLSRPAGAPVLKLVLITVGISVLLNYLTTLRYFVIQRSDETFGFQFRTWLLAPIAGLWRLMLLRPIIIYCYVTFWQISNWGTRAAAEVTTGLSLALSEGESTVEETQYLPVVGEL